MTQWLSWLSVEYADQIEMTLRLLGATVAGMIIGINRDIHNKPIGMRTLGLVSLGAAIVILSGSVYEGLHFGQDAVSRVVQGILTGLGFLGAGSILRAKDGTEVQGLTTASTVWIAAALGVTAGLGAWFITIAGTLVTLVLLTYGTRLERRSGRLVHHHRRHSRHARSADLWHSPRAQAHPRLRQEQQHRGG